MQNFGLDIWGDDNYIIKDGKIALNYMNYPSLIEMTKSIRDRGHKGPLILRFPHIIKKQISTLFDAFDSAIEEFGYTGSFNAVFPLKVNQFPNFVNSLMRVASPYGYGLEAGSKAELVIAISKTPIGTPITVNGFKDKEMISLCFIAAKMNHNITITIEGLGELQTIIEVNQEFNQNSDTISIPKIGVRIRLHSSGIGVWAKSGGYSSKFGLTSTELLEAYELLSCHKILDRLSMVHFHIGSQMGEIAPLKKALREAGNIYADLKRRGASSLSSINIGGGLAVEYSQHKHAQERNYSLKEFANDVVYLMQEISTNKGVEPPDIYTESGRYIAASHSVLIAPVLELFSQEYHQKSLRLKDKNPPLVEELNDLYSSMTKANAREYLHDGLDHMESLLTLFDLGYIDLEDRSNTEILVNLIIKRAIYLLKDEDSSELKRLQSRIQEKYLVNFSVFESLPDFWGLNQQFPVVPLDRLDIKPNRPASLWDITCDSDGEIGFDPKLPLYLHDIDVKKDEYFLGFFLTGAYQEVLGMQHNLFTHPTEVVVNFDKDGKISYDDLIEAQNLMDILDDLDYDIDDIDRRLRQYIGASDSIGDDEKRAILDKLHLYLSENSYLKTIQALENKG
ncbi:Arginine decarboxylase [hydrothermal vent metagenome]|uniref:arginine decarboxylase n=1 Tax=hydrothermal vent metagenome TaxID=652676 RepID=A0A1W1C2K8_9ZZZZ